jgi:hypothetical protein
LDGYLVVPTRDFGKGVVIGEKEYVGSGFVDDLVVVCRGRQPAV